MYVIGLTGCAGSGKSYVCECAKRTLGIPVIDSDYECRCLQEPGQPVLAAIVREFGPSCLNADGTLNRSGLAAVVFSDKEALERLNRITHPATIERIRELLAEYEKNGEEFVFVESALAANAGYRSFCDELWLVYASDETRAERLRTTRGYSEEKIKAVFSSQVPQQSLFSACDRVIDNDAKIGRFGILRQMTFYLDDIRRKLRSAKETSN